MQQIPSATPYSGDQIRAIRDDLAWSRAELSRRAGVSESVVYDIEIGRSTGTLHTIRSILRAMHADLYVGPGVDITKETAQ